MSTITNIDNMDDVFKFYLNNGLNATLHPVEFASMVKNSLDALFNKNIDQKQSGKQAAADAVELLASITSLAEYVTNTNNPNLKLLLKNGGSSLGYVANFAELGIYSTKANTEYQDKGFVSDETLNNLSSALVAVAPTLYSLSTFALALRAGAGIGAAFATGASAPLIAIATVAACVLTGLALLSDDKSHDIFDSWKNAWHWLTDTFKSWLNLDRSGEYHFYYSDPLALDLDGDGIETIGANGQEGTFFDHNNNGIKQATGWLKSDDGFLVFDRDGDGTISGGNELFGNNTLLSGGEYAEHGYAALAELDTNNDGMIDAQDTEFANLRIWRDLNADGQSQEGELFSLADANVKSLAVGYTDTNTALAGGNILAQNGSFTRNDGTTGQMGDINFRLDTLHTQFTDPVELTEEQKKWPNLSGIGNVRDLREAAALSESLAEKLLAYAAAETKADQENLLSGLVNSWAATAFNYSEEINLELGKLTSGGGMGFRAGTVISVERIIPEDLKERFNSLKYKIAALDALTGTETKTLYFITRSQLTAQFDTIDATYSALSKQVYSALLFQTRLKPYLDVLQPAIIGDKYALDYVPVTEKFREVFANNPEKAFVDLSEFLFTTTSITWSDGVALFNEFSHYAQEHNCLAQWKSLLDEDPSAAISVLSGASSNESFVVDPTKNTILDAGDGADTITPKNLNSSSNTVSNVFTGGKGDDSFNLGTSNDLYIFNRGDGHDTIQDLGSSALEKDGVDILAFGEGITLDDIRFSRNGNDLEIRVGDGSDGSQDAITIKNWNDKNYRLEWIRFADGTRLTTSDINRLSMTGGTSNDTFELWNDATFVFGNGGNDTILSKQPFAYLSGGDGDDNITILGESGFASGGDGYDSFNLSTSEKLREKCY